MIMNRSEESPSIDLVTVTFSGDLRLLELQILSVDQYWQHSDINEYTILINDIDHERIKDHLDDFLIRRISDSLRSRITIKNSTDVGGWDSQQYIKLAAVSNSSSDWVLVLDSKNHFLKKVTAADYVNNGKGYTYKRKITGSQTKWLAKSLAYFDLDFDDESMPTITPYIMNKELVKEMLFHVKNKVQDKYKNKFLSSPELKGATEFFLYFAFLKYKGILDDYYIFSDKKGETLFTVWPQDHSIVKRYLLEALDDKYLYLGLHRRRIPQLDEQERFLLGQIWLKILGTEPCDYYLNVYDAEAGVL